MKSFSRKYSAINPSSPAYKSVMVWAENKKGIFTAKEITQNARLKNGKLLSHTVHSINAYAMYLFMQRTEGFEIVETRGKYCPVNGRFGKKTETKWRYEKILD